MGISASLKKIKPGYRVMSVVAGTAVFAGAAFFVTAGANADTQQVPQTFDTFKSAGSTSGAGRATTTKASREHKTPNAKETARTSYKLGKTGPAFQPKSAKRIIGGQNANPADHPGVVGIQTLWHEVEGGVWKHWISTCTGTVLSPTRILTAGHCSFYTGLGTTYVIAGRADLDNESAGFATTVRSTFTHQGYTELQSSIGWVPQNDVAVLTLTNPLPPAYTPVTINTQGDESATAPDTQAQIVGYGFTENDDLGLLRQANVPIKSDSACSSLLERYDGANMVCAGIPATPGNTGVDTCGGDSGGPLFATKSGVKTQVGITSWGPPTCAESYGAYVQVGSYSNLIKTEQARKGANNLDWTGDGHSDLITRDGNGELTVYSGSGLVNPSFPDAFTPDPRWIGTGWGSFRKVFRVWNWNNDNRPSIFAVDTAGKLFQYKGDGEGEFVENGTVQIGTGWNGFNDIMVTNNWTGNGRPNLLGRAPNGDLFLYTSDGNGGWENNGSGVKIGTGWGAFNTIITPGEWLGDGRQSLIGRTAAGDLRLYQSDGNGGWVNGMGVQIGNGWNGFNVFMSPGDFNGDNRVDMIGVTPAGQMRLYTTDGAGNWLGGGVGQPIGSGWNVFNAIF